MALNRLALSTDKGAGERRRAVGQHVLRGGGEQSTDGTARGIAIDPCRLHHTLRLPREHDAQVGSHDRRGVIEHLRAGRHLERSRPECRGEPRPHGTCAVVTVHTHPATAKERRCAFGSGEWQQRVKGAAVESAVTHHREHSRFGTPAQMQEHGAVARLGGEELVECRIDLAVTHRHQDQVRAEERVRQRTRPHLIRFELRLPPLQREERYP